MDEYRNLNEMTSRDYLRVVFRQKTVVICTVLTVMLTTIVGLSLSTPVYQAQVKMLISGLKQVQAGYYTDIGIGGLRSDQITLTQTEIVTSDPVIERAVVALGLVKKPFNYEEKFSSALKKPLINFFVGRFEKKLERLPSDQMEAYRFRIAMEDLRNRIKVDPVRNTDLFLIKVTDFNPAAAMVQANVVSRSYMMFDLEQQLAETQLKFGEKHQAVIQLREAIEKLSRGLNGAPLSAIDAIGPATVKIIEQAKIPLKPSGIPRALTLLLAVLVSGFLSIMAGFSFEYLDQTFRSPSETGSFLGINYLGSLPNKPSSDDHRHLAEQLYLVLKDSSMKTFLFVSALPQEGATGVIVSLGRYMAKNLNLKVLLVDANFRNPQLAKKLGMAGSPDLLNILDGKVSFEKGARSFEQNLDVVLSGSSNGTTPVKGNVLNTMFSKKSNVPALVFNPIATLESPKFKEFFQQAGERYDLVLTDAAPLGEVKDAAVLSPSVDGVIAIVSERKARRHVVKTALETLKGRKANVVGVILNNRQFPIPKMIYDRV